MIIFVCGIVGCFAMSKNEYYGFKQQGIDPYDGFSKLGYITSLCQQQGKLHGLRNVHP
jgi:hypothetical protein